MHADWYQAAHPRPANVLKLRLRDYCLGHEILLRERGITTPSTQPQLCLAAVICAQTYEAGRRTFHRYETSRLHRFSTDAFMAIWKRLLKDIDLERELEAFHQYRLQAFWEPELEDESGRGRRPGSPLDLRILHMLMSKYRFTESEALNYPLSRATALLYAGAEQEGRVKILDQDMVDALFAKNAELEAAGAIPAGEEVGNGS